ncbi:MAG: gamma-glutamyl-gamma-aminobutyrate hydrolase family protein [Wenzhouxiangella sp.]|nr:gamma-glutamyl-gamma-aminobutyrate hydrolase family protein [Wenzhouxiangella sp.]
MSGGRPVVGITGPDKGGLSAWLFTAHAVRRAGGRPLRIRPGKPHGIEQLDALIIGGGADVSPQLYGAEPAPKLESLQDRGLPGWRRLAGILLFPLLLLIRRLLMTKTGGLNEARDQLERRLITAARSRKLPMLGICRGMQLLNVAAGGTLHQDLEGFYEEHPAIRSVLPRKQIELNEDSRLARILGMTRVRVNALHSQAIDRLGTGMTICAHEASGIVQAIEQTGAEFALGVQWHPEYLPQRPEQRALFRALVQAAAGPGSA